MGKGGGRGPHGERSRRQRGQPRREDDLSIQLDGIGSLVNWDIWEFEIGIPMWKECGGRGEKRACPELSLWLTYLGTNF